MKKMSIEKTYKQLLKLREMNKDWKILHQQMRRKSEVPNIFFRNVLSKKQLQKAVFLVLVVLLIIGVSQAIITTGWAAILFFPVTVYAALTITLPITLSMLAVLLLYNLFRYYYNKYCFQPKVMKKRYFMILKKTKEQSIVPMELIKIETVERMLNIIKREKTIKDEQVIQWFRLANCKNKEKRNQIGKANY